MKTLSKDQYDYWCPMITTIACFYACVKLIPQSQLADEIYLGKEQSAYPVRFLDLT